MFAWIPIIGPIIQGIVSIFNKRADVDLGKRKSDNERAVEETKASTRIIEATNDNIGINISRDIIIFPVAVWTAIISWDTVVAIRFPEWMFHVEKYPDSVAYLPLAVITFLLGNIGINAWRRR